MSCTSHGACKVAKQIVGRAEARRERNQTNEDNPDRGPFLRIIQTGKSAEHSQVGNRSKDCHCDIFSGSDDRQACYQVQERKRPKHN